MSQSEIVDHGPIETLAPQVIYDMKLGDQIGVTVEDKGYTEGIYSHIYGHIELKLETLNRSLAAEARDRYDVRFDAQAGLYVIAYVYS